MNKNCYIAEINYRIWKSGQMLAPQFIVVNETNRKTKITASAVFVTDQTEE